MRLHLSSANHRQTILRKHVLTFRQIPPTRRALRPLLLLRRPNPLAPSLGRLEPIGRRPQQLPKCALPCLRQPQQLTICFAITFERLGRGLQRLPRQRRFKWSWGEREGQWGRRV
jgi:hypothetical protein